MVVVCCSCVVMVLVFGIVDVDYKFFKVLWIVRLGIIWLEM